MDKVLIVFLILLSMWYNFTTQKLFAQTEQALLAPAGTH